jgi:hypothetical protein
MTTRTAWPCCDQPLRPTPDSCTIEQYEYADGDVVDRIPFGHDREHWIELGIIPPERCRDCGVKLGGYHHPQCCIERCPRCGVQNLTCHCDDD